MSIKRTVSSERNHPSSINSSGSERSRLGGKQCQARGSLWSRWTLTLMIIMASTRLSASNLIEKWTIGIPGGPSEADQVAGEQDYKNLGLVRGFDDVYLFEKRVSKTAVHRNKRALEAHPLVAWVDPQLPHERIKRGHLNVSELLERRASALAERQLLRQHRWDMAATGVGPPVGGPVAVGSGPHNQANYNNEQQHQMSIQMNMSVKLNSQATNSNSNNSDSSNNNNSDSNQLMMAKRPQFRKKMSSPVRGFYSTFAHAAGADQRPFNDELWGHQWYLQDNVNMGQLPDTIELRVEEVWRMGFTGAGVVVTILDDGLEWNHTDILPNYDARASWDMNNNRSDPFPRYDSYESNSHGTRCAGEVAMVANNRKCGVGVAPRARIGGIKCLDGEVADHIESMSMLHNIDHIDIYSGSWGPSDNGQVVDGPKRLASQALERGVRFGRKGRGALYVWANGNGGATGDNCNCDGYVNSIYTISIGGVTQQGQIPFYGERCASTMAVTCSSGAYTDRKIVTTDLHNKCTIDYTGTSAAAPLAAGVYALMLEANSNLTWRDAQHLTAWTSNPLPIRDNPGWKRNAAGLYFNSRFGFGLLNAKALVDAALKWQTVPKKSICRLAPTSRLPLFLQSRNMGQLVFVSDGCQQQQQQQQQHQVHQNSMHQHHSPLVQGDFNSNSRVLSNLGPHQRSSLLSSAVSAASASSLSSPSSLSPSSSSAPPTDSGGPVIYLEHVQLIVDIEYSSRGSLDLFLISPSGTMSTMLARRPLDVSRNGFDKWPLMSVHFWGESSLGQWRLIIRDKESQNNRGLLRNVTLVLHGTSQRPAHMLGQSMRVYPGETEISPFVDPTPELDEEDIYDLNTFPNELSLVYDDSFLATFVKTAVAKRRQADPQAQLIAS